MVKRLRLWVSALAIPLLVLGFDSSAISAQPSGNGSEVVATDSGGGPPQRVSGPGASADPNAPVYACYFARQYTNDRGEARQGDQFIHDTAGPDLVEGLHYARQCLDDTGAVVDFGVIQYTPFAGTVTDERQIANFWVQNSKDLDPQAHEFDLSPDANQITGLETWIDQPGPTELGPDWASAGSVTVGVRGRLVDVLINPGDGSAPFNCDPTDFAAWTAGATNAGCSHTYWEEPTSGSYQMQATYFWTYDWLPDGQTIWELDFFQDAEVVAFDVAVVDLEAVISN